MFIRTAAQIALPVLILFASRASQAETTAPAVDAGERAKIIAEVSKLLGDLYIFPDAAKAMSARMTQRNAEGAYAKAKGPQELAAMIGADLREISKDKHLNFIFAPPMAADLIKGASRDEAGVRKLRETEIAAMRRDNFGFRRVERLPGNVGYLDFRFFAPASVGGPTAIAALNFLSGCDAVIVDLRQNGGGDPSQIQLMTTYFFKEATHLNDIYTRSTNLTENFWTLPYVPGPKLDQADVYVLTSGGTFSGAEEFSYNLKNLKRATLIGETTGGGAHPTDSKPVRGKYVLNVPVARAINPISKTNWEGTGVAPDVAVPAAEAFDRAYVLALEKLAAKVKVESNKNEVQFALDGLRAKKGSPTVAPELLAKYAGVYGERKIIFENGALYYQRSGPRFRLIPMTERLFAVEGFDYFRVEFVVKNGKSVELIGWYENGEKEPLRRNG